MTHLTLHEWKRAGIGGPGGFSRAEANLLAAAARAHPLAQQDGGNILVDHHTYLRAQQMVGVIAAEGCSLEILPKIDLESSDDSETDNATLRARLIDMLDVAYGLDIGEGAAAAMARDAPSLLEILIRIFADRLLALSRRGLPRAYLSCEEDLPRLRGRLDVARQFTAHAVRPDRLACRFDELTSDIALVQIMKAAVIALARHARGTETRRRLHELRFVLTDISDVPISALPWSGVHFDRTNRRWQGLLRLARLLLKRDWQAAHYDPQRDHGVTLLFPMNKLFETYIGELLTRALTGSGIEVITQGGRRACLGDWNEGVHCVGKVFQTIPDIILRERRSGQIFAILDAKWKRLAKSLFDNKKGVQQSDVYQLMAYARVYDCARLMLVYPSLPGEQTGIVHRFGIHGGHEMLALGRVDVFRGHDAVCHALSAIVKALINGSGHGSDQIFSDLSARSNAGMRSEA